MSTSYEFDASETDATREGSSQDWLRQSGEYMLVAKRRDEQILGGHPAYVFEFEVLSGRPKDPAAGSQVGKVFEQSFFLPNPMEPDAKKRARNAEKLSRLGIATEAITVEAYTTLTPEGKRIVKVDWDHVLGRPFMAKVSPGYKDPKYVEISWGEDICHVASERMKEVPKDEWTMANVQMSAECPFARIKQIEDARKNGHAAKPEPAPATTNDDDEAL